MSLKERKKERRGEREREREREKDKSLERVELIAYKGMHQTQASNIWRSKNQIYNKEKRKKKKRRKFTVDIIYLISI